MSFQPLDRVRSIYDEYPRQFWVLIGALFIDRLGGAFIFPFFSLYITKKFGVGMTQVGLLFGIFSIASVAGSMLGGALTDRLGRKGMVIFGLVLSGLTSLLMGVVGSLELFFGAVLILGTFANIGGPAQQAMVADLLPEKKRAQGFGILRVVANLAVAIGPAIGGFLAGRSYLLLFICDAVASVITAGIVYLALQETRPAPCEGAPEQTMAQTFGGYLDVLRDNTFLLFIGACVLMVLVAMQMNLTLPVYLRDTHSVPEQGFGYLLSLNAAMVVLFQFPISRRISKYRPLMVMVGGMLLYTIGFAMYGFVSTYVLFLVAIAVLTIGEMMTAPTAQALASQFAPDHMRGRYLAVFGFTWVIPMAVGPLLSGLIMDNADPRWVWYAAGVVGLMATGAFALLERRAGQAGWEVIDRRLRVLEMLEERKISAAEAADLLQALDGERQWAAATPSGPSKERRHLRFEVSDLASGVMKTSLTLPMGLVNTVLDVGGRLSDDLDLDLQKLEKLVASGSTGSRVETMDTEDNERVEVHVE